MLSILTLTATMSWACAGDEPNPPGPTDSGVVRDVGSVDTGIVADGGTPDSGVDAGQTDAEPMSCAPPTNLDLTPDPACTGDWTVIVTGYIQDQDDAPVFDAAAQLCLHTAGNNSALICLLPKFTCPDGQYTVIVPEASRCIDTAVMRSLQPDLPYATSYCDVVTSSARLDMPPIRLFETVAPESLPPEGDASMARWVRFAGGLEIEVTPEDMAGGYDSLGARRLSSNDPAPCFTKPGRNDTIYAFVPETRLPAGGFRFRLPNADSLPAGTAVELFVLGGLDCEVNDVLVPEGDWFNYGQGNVSADRQFIEGNVPCLTWFGIRTP